MDANTRLHEHSRFTGSFVYQTSCNWTAGSWATAARVRGLFDGNGNPLPHPDAGHLVEDRNHTPSEKRPCDTNSLATPVCTEQPQEFFFVHAGNAIGPMTELELQESVHVGNVIPTTLVATEPNGEWVAASQIQGLFDENADPLPHSRKANQLSHRNLDGIESIGVDEVQWKRGHKYQTLVYQIVTVHGKELVHR